MGRSLSTGRRSPARSRSRGQRVRGASEQVAIQIQHAIQADGMAPGDFLGREEDLARDFGVSRPTLREALRILASGNLVRANKGPGGGIFVAHTADQGISVSLSNAIAMMLETGAATLEELLDARLILEAPLAGLAAYNADDEAKARLRAAVEAEAATDAGDPESLGVADAEIHRTVAAASGNRMLQALVGWVFEVLQPQLVAKVHGTVVQSAVIDQHQALLRAVERGDSARAERAMKDHLLYLRDVLRMVEERGG